jgi:hypothetical protein
MSILQTLVYLLPWYVLTVAIETPILIAGLSGHHPLKRRLFAGVWLTACTYPIVTLVLPSITSPTHSHAAYLIAAETFAPAAECALFWLAFGLQREQEQTSMWRDFAAVIVANITSFACGEALKVWL